MVGRRASHLDIDVGRLVQEVYDAIRTDQKLCRRFGLTRPRGHGPAVRSPAAKLLVLELTGIVDAALTDRGDLAGASFARFIGDLHLTGDDYDRLAHYLLTVALAHRVGPDNLLRIGALLTDLRITAVTPS